MMPTEEFAEAVLEGLGRTPKSLSPKFLYDARGSELFERICECPEYYPTRTETVILERQVRRIADLMEKRPVIFELGSGSSRKTRILLNAADAAAYVPIEISRDSLLQSCGQLRQEYPRLPILPLCADFTRPLPLAVSELPPDCGRRVAFFPGSTIGNFEPPAAEALLRRLADFIGPGGQLLVGFDRVKPREVLEPAYDDAAGITAEFNLNLLHRLRRELGAQLDPAGFRHRAIYNEHEGRIEMHLLSLRWQQIGLRGRTFDFEPGETLQTESSYKYTPAKFVALAARAGFEKRELWTDSRSYFGVGLFETLRSGRGRGCGPPSDR